MSPRAWWPLAPLLALVAGGGLGACSDGADAAVGSAPDDAGATADASADAEAGAADATDEDAATYDPSARVTVPTMLSQLGLFAGGPGAGGQLAPAAGNVGYDLSTPLFSDYALKQRTVRVPPGAKAHYDATAVLDFPVGTIFSKTFAFAADLRAPDQAVRVVETRILVRQPSGWEAWPYVWSADQADAKLAPGGRVLPVSFVDASGGAVSFGYLVPSKNQCEECHHVLDPQGQHVMVPIGPKARYLHHARDYGGVVEDQLAHLAALGWLDGLPAPAAIPRAPDAFDPSDGTLEARARAYLDINCAHCHNPRGTAGVTSQLFLDAASATPLNLGVCKRPGSGGSDLGGKFDVVPGSHTQSILWFRLSSTESGKMMPLLGRTLEHTAGAALIADWIDAMPAQACE